MARFRAQPTGVTRGQIAMWMLTKMSMLFFILMLAFLMTQLSGTFRNALCNDQARLSAQRLAGGISDVVNSPLEDERKVLPLESALSVGGADLARYTINITDSPDVQSQVGATQVYTGELRVTADTQGECHGSGRVPYDRFKVTLLPDYEKVPADEVYQGLLGGALTLPVTPSSLDHRAQYLVVVKCSRKEYPPVKQLYVESCYQDNPDRCVKFDVVADDGRSPACNPNPPAS